MIPAPSAKGGIALKRLFALLLAACAAMMIAGAAAETPAMPAVIMPFLEYPDVFDVIDPDTPSLTAYSGGSRAAILTRMSGGELTAYCPDMGEGGGVTARFCLVVLDPTGEDWECCPILMLTIFSPVDRHDAAFSLIAGDTVYTYPIVEGDNAMTVVRDGMTVRLVQVYFGKSNAAQLDALSAYFRSAGSLEEANALPVEVILYGDSDCLLTLAEPFMQDYDVLVDIGFGILMNGRDRMPETGTPWLEGVSVTKITPGSFRDK